MLSDYQYMIYLFIFLPSNGFKITSGRERLFFSNVVY